MLRQDGCGMLEEGERVQKIIRGRSQMSIAALRKHQYGGFRVIGQEEPNNVMATAWTAPSWQFLTS
jgi:hypothetical protein